MRLMKIGLAALSIAVSASAASAHQYLWFYGTGDSAGGVFKVNGHGDVVSGYGVFNSAALGTLNETIAPGSGNEPSFIWDNRFPVDYSGLLFVNGSHTLQTNLFAPFGGTASVGVTPNVSLWTAPNAQQNYLVQDTGTLTITALSGNTYSWFYGTGDSAGGVFNVNSHGDVVSGNGVFNTAALGTLNETIAPGSGNEPSFIWDNRFPVDYSGLLFVNGSQTLQTNIFAPFGGTASVGVTPNVSLWTAPNGQQHYLVQDTGTLTILDGANAGVPEPSGWALMILGFGALGAHLRRRRLAPARCA